MPVRQWHLPGIEFGQRDLRIRVHTWPGYIEDFGGYITGNDPEIDPALLCPLHDGVRDIRRASRQIEDGDRLSRALGQKGGEMAQDDGGAAQQAIDTLDVPKIR